MAAKALSKIDRESADRLRRLRENLDAVDSLVNRGYLADLPRATPLPFVEDEDPYEDMALFRLEKIVYLKGEDVNDKLVSVYGALSAYGSTAMLVIHGTRSGVSFYLGTRESSFDRRHVSEGIFESSLRGNFPGVEMAACNKDEVKHLMEEAFPSEYRCRSLTSVTVVPSERASHSGEQGGFVQGIEKFIEGMAGQEFTALLLATPVDDERLSLIRRTYEELSTSLSMFREVQRQLSEQESLSVTDGVNDSFSAAISNGFSDTAGSHSDSSLARSKSRDRHRETLLSKGTKGGSSGTTSTETSGTNESHTTSRNDTETRGSGTSHSDSTTTGSSRSLTITQTDKTVSALLERIDRQLERIAACEAYGVWEVGCYFVAGFEHISIMAASLFKALVSGENSQLESAHVNTWPNDRPSFSRLSVVFEYLREARQPNFVHELPLNRAKSFPNVAPTTLVSGEELPLVLGLPRHSVSGVTATSSAEFGRNVLRAGKGAPRRTIELGVVSYMGRESASIPVLLDVDSLTAHCFITGSTGSGKSNTTYQILNELADEKNDVPFLVIEPAKGEYKLAFGRLPDVNVFTTNPRYNDMLHVNPFAFPEEIHVLEHLDRIIEVFSACWPLYAAMPALLKKAFERAYILHGWDLANSYWVNLGNGRWPTFSDVVRILPELLASSAFSGDTKGDYVGSLVTRVESLTNGLVGQIFTREAVAPEILFDQRTIVDLSRIGSTETKALITGTLILQLNEYRQATSSGTNASLRHVTVLEEAHNLLRRTSTDQSQEGSNVQGKSVEMISNSIAEMRTYGEGFLIVDQSPSAVDMSAIRNTNTKIVMRLPELEDRTAAGASMGLSEDQLAEIAKLPMGCAVVYQNDWLEPVLTKVNRAEALYERTSAKVNDPARHAELVGRVVEELFRQHDEGELSVQPFEVLVRQVQDTATNKRAMRRMISALVYACSKKIDEEKFGMTVARLIGAGDLFEVLAERLPEVDPSAVTTADRRDFDQWKRLAKDSLAHYVRLGSDKLKERVLCNHIVCVCVERSIASWERYDAVRRAFL